MMKKLIDRIGVIAFHKASAGRRFAQLYHDTALAVYRHVSEGELICHESFYC